ncbi:MAG: hypothetical protein A3E80_02335 [Chlamydiae bacterium RIFCSPHIGHO2_12_FULL_49_9]|nr:MAG: hypothetical protein A3E80_02335 [Chlamydiae bacterium RIFCSPHIGHO2_12_FULL_49_9]
MRKNARLILLLLLAAACSSNAQWQLDGIASQNKAFDSARLRYLDAESTPLVFEMLRIGETVESFLSLSRFHLTPTDEDKVLVTLSLGEEKTEVLLPLLKGGMRLHLPHELTEELTRALQNGLEVSIVVDGFRKTLLPDQFAKSFSQFMGEGLQLTKFLKGPLG